MSSAKKCDKCGKLVEAWWRRAVEVTVDYHYQGQERYDFCDECYAELCEWLKIDPKTLERLESGLR